MEQCCTLIFRPKTQLWILILTQQENVSKQKEFYASMQSPIMIKSSFITDREKSNENCQPGREDKKVALGYHLFTPTHHLMKNPSSWPPLPPPPSIVSMMNSYTEESLNSPHNTGLSCLLLYNKKNYEMILLDNLKIQHCTFFHYWTISNKLLWISHFKACLVELVV